MNRILKYILFVYVGFLPFDSIGGEPDFQSPTQIRTWYQCAETNLINRLGTEEPRDRVIFTLGAIRSTNSISRLLPMIDYSSHKISYHELNGHRFSLQSAARTPGIAYPVLVALEYIPVPMDAYLNEINESPVDSLKMDLLSESAFVAYGTQFLARAESLVNLDEPRWNYVTNHVGWFSKGSLHHFSTFIHDRRVDLNVVNSFRHAQSNLLSIALSACMEQNPTNLLDIVSTYRFIHAPIPEAISTNDFFQATIGEE